MPEAVSTHLTFSELLATVRQSGYDVVDANGRAVNEQLQSAVEDSNLMAAPVQVSFRTPPSAEDPAVVADLSVAQQVFGITGDARGVGELKNRIRGLARDGGEPQRGTLPR